MKEKTVNSKNIYKLIKKTIKELEKQDIPPQQLTFFLSDFIGEWLINNWELAHKELLFIPPNPIDTYGYVVYVSSNLLSKYVNFAIKNNLEINMKAVKIEI